MDRKELVDMIVSGTSIFRHFISGPGHSPCPEGSFEDWSDCDVVGHVVAWMKYSSDKLSCLKSGARQNDTYAQAVSLEDINRIVYDTNRGKSREETETAYLDSLGRYLTTISLFSGDDIILDTFDTGFKMALWRYMLMDTVIHPVQHVLYQYFKRSEFDRLVDAIKASKGIFMRYSGGMKAHTLDEFGMDRPEYQAKLNRMEAEYGGDVDVGAFVRLNRAM